MKRPGIALWIGVSIFGILSPGSLLVAQAQAPDPPLPEFKAFVAEVKSRLRMDQSVLKNFTYQQRNSQKHLDKNGRVKKNIVMEGRDTIHGRPAIRFSFKPKPGMKAKSDEVKVLRKFAGRVWFDEALYELVWLQLQAVDDVSFGFGLLAKLHKGAKAVLERRLYNDEVWLPSSVEFAGNLRLLLFKSMKMEVTDEFFDYRKFTVETSVSYEPK